MGSAGYQRVIRWLGLSPKNVFSYPEQGVANIQIFEYIRIFSGTNIHSYHIRIISLMRIYSDIRLYHIFHIIVC